MIQIIKPSKPKTSYKESYKEYKESKKIRKRKW